MEKLYFISTQTAHLFQTIAKIKINYKISKTGKTASVYSKKNGPITHYKGDLKIVAGITIFFPMHWIVIWGTFFSAWPQIIDEQTNIKIFTVNLLVLKIKPLNCLPQLIILNSFKYMECAFTL